MSQEAWNLTGLGLIALGGLIVFLVAVIARYRAN
jgi:hypothetical protein